MSYLKEEACCCYQPSIHVQELYPSIAGGYDASVSSNLCLRAKNLSFEGITFSANEVGLHEGSDALGSARACHQLESVVVLRNAVERARSHVTEIMRVYMRYDLNVFELAMHNESTSQYGLHPRVKL